VNPAARRLDERTAPQRAVRTTEGAGGGHGSRCEAGAAPPLYRARTRAQFATDRPVGKAGDAARSQETTLVRATKSDPRGRAGGVIGDVAAGPSRDALRAPFLDERVPVVRSHVAVTVVLLAATACVDRPAPAAAPAAGALVVDEFGDTLRVGQPFRRIVSLDPTITEILFAIGAGQKLVGRSHWDAWPAAALRLPDLGPGIRPNVEAVLATRPDLVVLYASEDNRGAAARLRGAGVATAAFRVDQIDAFRRVTPLLGRLSGDSVAAGVTVDSVDRSLERVRAATAGRARPKVLIPAWDTPLIVIGGGSFVSQIVSIAGGDNVYGRRPERSPQVTLEDVVRRDPDVILIGPERRERYVTDPRWRSLRAVRDGRVLTMDTALVWRASTRMGEAAASIARLLHPDAVP
jgi:iron complex transport system substrate-binding protein